MGKSNVDLFQIIRNGELEQYYQNITNTEINIRNEFGQSLLHEAIAYKQKEIALDLLNKLIDINIQDNSGQTVLHFISFHDKESNVAEKIIENGGNLGIVDQYGNTPLWYAVFNARGKYDLVELFMKKGANPALKNNAGRSPIDFATQIKDTALLNILQTK
jgi:ankyrin repeat protein